MCLASVFNTDADQLYYKLQGLKGNSAWGGIRVPYDYVKKYFNVSNPRYNFDPGYTCTTEELLTRDLGYTVADNRGRMFYINGRQEDMGKDELYDFLHGWSSFK